MDAHVGKHLFEECLQRYLGGKTRILATHQLQYMKGVDKILLLDQGKMSVFNDYHELLASFPHYQDLIAAETGKESSEDAALEKSMCRRRRLSSSSNRVFE